MPTRRTALLGCKTLVLLLLSPAAGCSVTHTQAAHAAAHVYGQADEQAIRAVLQAQSEAWNSGDIDGFMEGYARGPELVFTSGGTVRRGWDVTLRRYKERYGSSPSTMGHLRFEIIEIRGVGNDAATVLGRWILNNTAKAGSGIFSLVLERRAEGWRIIHDHTSTSPNKKPTDT